MKYDMVPGTLVSVYAGVGKSNVVSLMSHHPDRAALVESETGVPIISRSGRLRSDRVGTVVASVEDYSYILTSEDGAGWIWTDHLIRV